MYLILSFIKLFIIKKKMYYVNPQVHIFITWLRNGNGFPFKV